MFSFELGLRFFGALQDLQDKFPPEHRLGKFIKTTPPAGGG